MAKIQILQKIKNVYNEFLHPIDKVYILLEFQINCFLNFVVV